MSRFIVVSADGIEANKPNFADAKKAAERVCIASGEDVVILEVQNAWQVGYPEEPEPETWKIDVKELES